MSTAKELHTPPAHSLPPMSTSHATFHIPSPIPSHPALATLLRGVNLSSSAKLPTYPPDHPLRPGGTAQTRQGRDELRRVAAGVRTDVGEEGGFWSEAEQGGRDGWFVGRPIQEKGADTHFRRLRAWGFTTIRWIIPWEALEHAGPGKYDEAYIEYTIRLLRLAKHHGLRVFISPHQDTFSRFLSGTGAPYWVLLALGLNPRRVHQTGAALVHACWKEQGWGGQEGRESARAGNAGDWPDMIWNTNLHRLAARHCFTMFYASEVFAPKCTIDGVPVGQWLRDHFNSAFGHLADRLRDAGDLLDTCVIGWDSLNEPHEGFIGIPDLNECPPTQDFKKGPSPTPIQAFRLGVGKPVAGVSVDDFTSLGPKHRGKTTITPPGEEGVWLTREEAGEAEQRWGWRWGAEWDFWDEDGHGGCPWAGHGVWDRKTGEVLKKDYFRDKVGGGSWEFIQDFWKPHYISFIARLRQSHREAISFVNPPIFSEPPDLSEDVKQGRLALSSHFYDGLTMLGKRRHVYNADAVGLQRGLKSMSRALKFGSGAIQNGLRDQLRELKSDAVKEDGVAEHRDVDKYPTIIGEIGTPFDMKDTKLLGLAKGKTSWGDYKQPAKAMDAVLNACDGRNALSYTLWCYEPLNSHAHGDGWNGEDLSLFSYDDVPGDDDLLADDPSDLKTLITLGSRGIESWCRPYPVEVTGRVDELNFDMSSGDFELRITVPALDGLGETFDQSRADEAVGHEACTKVFLPFVHYRSRGYGGDEGTKGKTRVVGLPEAGGREWEKGRGPAKVDLEVAYLSHGRLEVVGQEGRWFYDLRKSGGDQELRLKIRPWSG